MRTKQRSVVASVLIVGAALTILSGRSDEPAAQSSLPRYNAAGELLLPAGYRTWVFVGADLGLDYSQRNDQRLDYPQKKEDNLDDHAPFHNVYIDRAAYDHFSRTGQFPDKTVLVLELLESRRKEPRNIVTRGRYEGNRVALEVAVKDLNRPDGSRTTWAYYDFTGEPGPRGRRCAQQCQGQAR